MLQFLRKKQKIFLSIILVAEMFLTSALPASAGLFGGGPRIPSASSMASDLERRYHIDLGSMQNQGEMMNVSSNKQPTPEVSLFFSPSDPKPGEKISAKAFPMYFSNKETNIYYTWYLKRAECGLTSSPSASARAICDRNGDGRITVEDWKIEAAQILAQNGYDTTGANYATDTDNDGYRARYGGDNEVNTPNHCYVHDSMSGRNYELADASDTDWECPAGTTAVCMVGEGEINPETITIPSSTGGTSTGTTNEAFSVSDTDVCRVSGLPACTAAGAAQCSVGSARCVADPVNSTACGTALSTCSSDTASGASPYCRHLFANAPGHSSGDGTYGASEESFWGTDSNDPDTADNGSKDEANVVGLGQTNFVWNYSPGDQVGVAVEGTSMISTKHDDSSTMIMWALSKNNCPITLADGTGEYFRTIKGYRVAIPTADFDLNRCLERNLVDPAQGGQATSLEVEVSATPNNPLNDESVDRSGDVVVAQASVTNASRSLNEILFDWRVDISNNVQFRSGAGLFSADITSQLQDLGLLGNIRGNALDSVSVKLDLPATTSLGGRPLSSYLIDGSGYLRFTTRVTENFASGATRRGRSDVVVKFTSSGRKISAYKAEPTLVGGSMHVALPPLSNSICNTDPLDRAICRVIRNEVIGMRVDPTGLSNFSWLINGTALNCDNTNVSPNCVNGQQNEINFFPVSGNVGDTYTVTVTANDVTTSRNVTLTRGFHIVEPALAIQSTNQVAAWPKFLGQYRDIAGTATVNCPGGLCNEYSDSIFQSASGSSVGFRAQFIPGFLATTAQRQWRVDGVETAESAVGEINFTASRPGPDVYNVTLDAQVVQSPETRRALLDIWGISPLDSPELHFSSANDLEILEEVLAQGPFQGTRKYLAALSSYIPASLMFTFRIMLSVMLIIFTAGFLFALLPERRTVLQRNR